MNPRRLGPTWKYVGPNSFLLTPEKVAEIVQVICQLIWQDLRKFEQAKFWNLITPPNLYRQVWMPTQEDIMWIAKNLLLYAGCKAMTNGVAQIQIKEDPQGSWEDFVVDYNPILASMMRDDALAQTRARVKGLFCPGVKRTRSLKTNFMKIRVPHK